MLGHVGRVVTSTCNTASHCAPAESITSGREHPAQLMVSTGSDAFGPGTEQPIRLARSARLSERIRMLDPDTAEYARWNAAAYRAAGVPDATRQPYLSVHSNGSLRRCCVAFTRP